MGKRLALGGLLTAILLMLAWLALGDDQAPSTPAGTAPAPAGDRGDGPPAVIDGAVVAPAESPGERLRTDAVHAERPASPGGAAAAGGRAPDGLTIRVAHADGVPASAARVALTHADELLVAGRAGERLGLPARARDLPPDAPLTVWVAGTSDRLVSLPVIPGDLAAGTLELALPRGLMLEGQVLLDGAPLTRPLDLALRPARAFRSTSAAPEAVAAALELPGCELDEALRGVAVRVEPPGRVRWSSLPAGWTGSVRFSDELLCAGPDCNPNQDGINLAAPGRDLTLELVSCATLTGRVLLPDGRPAVDAVVATRVEFMIIRNSRPEVTTDEDGRFAIPCRWDESWVAHLRLTSADGRATATRQVADTHFGQGADLGDLWLEPLQGVELLTVRGDGRPIEGALVLPLLASGQVDVARVSPPTDSDGRTRLDVTRQDLGFSVQALLYATTTLEPAALAAGVPQPVVVEMEPCARLVLSVDRGAYEGPLAWQLRGEQHLFDDAEALLGPGPGRALVGVPRSTGGTTHMDGRVDPPLLSGTVTFAATDDPVLLSCLVPGQAFDVELATPTGHPLWSRPGVVLPAGEETAIHAVLGEVVERVISGQVVDTAGQPVPGAQLYAELISTRDAGGGLAEGAHTDEQGRFAFDPLPDVEIVVDVAATGYEPQVLDPAPRGELLIVLVPEG